MMLPACLSSGKLNSCSNSAAPLPAVASVICHKEAAVLKPTRGGMAVLQAATMVKSELHFTTPHVTLNKIRTFPKYSEQEICVVRAGAELSDFCGVF